MTQSSPTPAPSWFKIVSIGALIWNALGVFAYLMEAFMSDEAKALLPQDQQDLYAAVPAWVTGAFAIAVFAGLIGCIGLLLKKKWATPLFILSLLGSLSQNAYYFFMSDTIDVMGGAAVVMPILVIIIGIYLIWLSMKATSENWIG